MSDRIFEFRIWNKKYNTWMNHCAIIDCSGNIGNHYIEVCDNGQKIEHVVGLSKEENIIQQFTGLKDNNDKEIYEGDILTLEDKKNYQVFFERGCFMITFENGNDLPLLAYVEGKRCEIVGNIFENPKFLNKKDV